MIEADYQDYCKICSEAVESERAFSGFKSNSTYRTILEHVTQAQGAEYFNLIKQNSLFDKIPWNEVLKSDNIGSPQTYSYDIPGTTKTTSSSNLRYVYYALEILKTLKDKGFVNPTISEIGGGYGGLCYIINTLSSLFDLTINHYNIFDLPAPVKLTNKYLSVIKPGINATASTIGEKEFELDANHFLISNYAYSELDKSTRLMYIDKLLSKTKAGYIVWNSADKFDLFFKSTKLDLYPEIPNTGPNNKVMIYETDIV